MANKNKCNTVSGICSKKLKHSIFPVLLLESFVEMKFLRFSKGRLAVDWRFQSFSLKTLKREIANKKLFIKHSSEFTFSLVFVLVVSVGNLLCRCGVCLCDKTSTSQKQWNLECKTWLFWKVAQSDRDEGENELK